MLKGIIGNIKFEHNGLGPNHMYVIYVVHACKLMKFGLSMQAIIYYIM